MQQITPNTPKGSIRAMSVLVTALIVGMLMFAAVTVGLNQINEPSIPDKSTSNLFLIVAATAAVVLFVVARMTFSKRLEVARMFNQPLQQKLQLYQGALVMYMAMCEGAGLFSVIAYFLTGNYLFLIIVGAMAFAMYLKFPKKSTIFNDLQLDSKEQMDLT